MRLPDHDDSRWLQHPSDMMDDWLTHAFDSHDREALVRDWLRQALTPGTEPGRPMVWVGRGAGWLARLVSLACQLEDHEVTEPAWSALVHENGKPLIGGLPKFSVFVGEPEGGLIRNDYWEDAAKQTHLLYACRWMPETALWPATYLRCELHPEDAAFLGRTVERMMLSRRVALFGIMDHYEE